MSGNELKTEVRRGMVLQDRDRHLLRELGVMRVIDREQAKTAAGFGSASRTNRRLHRLTQSGFLKRFFLGTSAGGRKALYSLSRVGARTVDVPYRGVQRHQDEVIATDYFAQHQLAVNEIYCRLKYHRIPMPRASFCRWIAFTQPISSGLRLIPDGYVEIGLPSGMLAAFLEVDLGGESLRVWRDKVRNYLQLALSGEFERRFGQSRFRVLVLTHSERRMHSIRKSVAAITEKLFWFSSLEVIRSAGLFQSVWLRPKTEAKETLIRETP